MQRLPRRATLAALLAVSIGCDDGASPEESADAGPEVSDMASMTSDMASDMASTDAGSPDPCALAVEPMVEPALATGLAAALTGALDAAAAPGAAALVVLPDGRRWMGASGLDDVRRDAPLAPWARFRIASITKTFVAAAVLGRVEDGTWGLDDPVTDWVDGVDLDPGVTLRRLLNHTSGVFNYSDDLSFLLRRNEAQTPREVIAFALDREPGPAPGEVYLYSNTGYYLLGLALEAVSGTAFDAFMRAEIIDPSGLERTWMQQVEPPPSGCGIGQGHVSYDPVITEGFDMSWGWAAGGLAADLPDLCRWASALFGGDLVAPDTLDAMAVPTPLSIEGGEPYGLGIMRVQRAGRTVYGHTGSIMGYRGELFVDRDTGTCVAVQTNDFTARQEVIAEAIWGALPGP